MRQKIKKIRQLPNPPRRKDKRGDFVKNADNFFSALPDWSSDLSQATDEINDALAQIEIKLSEVTAAYDSISDMMEESRQIRSSCLALANFRGEWNELQGAIKIPASCLYGGELWLLIRDIDNAETQKPGISQVWYKIIQGA